MIRNRPRVYRSQTEPIINYYKEKELLVDIDGSKGIDEVWVQIKRQVEAALKHNWPET